MTPSMLNRRALMVATAFGAPLVTSSASMAQDPAAKPKVDCAPNLKSGSWDYFPRHTGYCEFRSRPTKKELPGAAYFKEGDLYAGFDITAGSAQSLSLHFQELKFDHPFTYEELTARIFVDGKQVWQRNGREPNINMHSDHMRYAGPVADVLAALRAGKALRVTLSSASVAPLTAMEYSLEGFETAYLDWEAFKVDIARQLAGGAECRPQGGLPCYFTTAACGAAGLPDDCFELTMLRRFRDRKLGTTKSGREEIATYYAMAPAILAAIQDRPDAVRRLARLYAFVVLPCAVLIRLGLGGMAHRLYRRSFQRLSASA